MRYAQIVAGRVHGVYEYAVLPVFASNIKMVPSDTAQPGDYYDEQGGTFTAPAPVEPTPEAVNAERDRRLLRFQFNGVWFQSRPTDRLRIAGAFSSALSCLLTSREWPEDFEWIAEDDSYVPMDIETVLAFGQAAADNEKLHIFACSALKKMNPIPANFAADEWWP